MTDSARKSRRWLLALLLPGAIMVACSGQPAQIADVPTLQSIVLPTRAVRTSTPSATPTPTATSTETPDTTATAAIQQLAASETQQAVETQQAAASATAASLLIATETAIFQTAEARVSATAAAAIATADAGLTATAEVATATFTPSPTPSDTATETPSLTPTGTPTPTETPALTPTSAAQTDGELFVDSTSFNTYRLQPSIELDSGVTGSLTHDQSALIYTFQGAAGQMINAVLARTGGSLDPQLIILDEKGREVARDSNASAGAAAAEIRGLTLAESGRYLVIATRFGGVSGLSQGDFSLLLTEAVFDEPRVGTFSLPIVYESIVTGTIDATNEQHVYTFRGTGGDVISIQMLRATGDLDTRVYLQDNVGNVLTWNDDDLLNFTVDSYVDRYVLPFDGYYSLVASRYLGAANSGDFRLKVSLDQAGVRGEPHPYVGALDHVNSRTLRDDGQFYTNFAAGDNAVEGNELRTQSLITFRLPFPNEADVEVSSATLHLDPCYESGAGFSALGELTIYADQYGRLDGSRSFVRPSAGARILTTVSSCSEQVDLTELIQSLYDDGINVAQFRLTFRNTQANGTGDEVLFTPNIRINFANR